MYIRYTQDKHRIQPSQGHPEHPCLSFGRHPELLYGVCQERGIMPKVRYTNAASSTFSEHFSCGVQTLPRRNRSSRNARRYLTSGERGTAQTCLGCGSVRLILEEGSA